MTNEAGSLFLRLLPREYFEKCLKSFASFSWVICLSLLCECIIYSGQ